MSADNETGTCRRCGYCLRDTPCTAGRQHDMLSADEEKATQAAYLMSLSPEEREYLAELDAEDAAMNA